MNFFDKLLIYFGYFMIISFLIAVIGCLFIIINKYSDYESKVLKKLGMIFIAQLIVYFSFLTSLSELFNKMLKNDFVEVLNTNNIVIKINGENADLPYRSQLIQDLKKFPFVMHNHSSPGKEIKIEILTNEKRLNMSLFRDSQDSSLYWVYNTDYESSTMNDIGQIRTLLLDKY